jgi:NAD(P)-dependent dehydrogenase (short-subunit alcohol dehydrogenase family)
VASTLGGADILCANVGVQQFGAIDKLTDDDWRFVLDVNVLGTIRTVREFLPLLRARDGFRRIVLTASLSVLAPAVRMAAYQTSKFAVLGFGETLRHELAPEGIGVTVMFPGGMITGHLQSSAEARPAGLGATGARDDDLTAMLAHRPVGADDIVMPEHAIRNLLADLEADEPYIVTHGTIRADYTERHDALVDAIDRMEKS